MKYQIPTGLFDILPVDSKDEWKCAYVWQYLESVVRDITKKFGYEEIRTPIFERAELFLRTVGESSDIAQKEMYMFQDKGDRQMALRPEGTAPVMRAFMENNLAGQGQYHKLFYIGPMFRYDRPQAGRYRQHHQFGVEAIGSKLPEQDAEIIVLLYQLLTRLGLKNLEVQLNSIGNNTVRANFKDALLTYLEDYLKELSPESQKRFEVNPLRILDSKNERDQEIISEAPSIIDFLDKESYDHFEKVKMMLNEVKIPVKLNPLLVRGLDYYNQVVFEITTDDLGAQNSLGGGGRYDGLLHSLGGPDLPACGFGAGMERIIQAMIRQNCTVPNKTRIQVFIIALGDESKRRAFQLTHHLRVQGISSHMDFSGRKIGKAMQHANQMKALYTIVIGENEIETDRVSLKNMDTGEEQSIQFENIVKALQANEHMERIEKESALMKKLVDLEFPTKPTEESTIILQNLKSALKETKAYTDEYHERLRQMKKLLEEDDS